MTKRPKIAKARGRSVNEWIGKSADSRPPESVLIRIFERHGGKCHISGRKILPGDKWQADHVKRLDDGGENRESNLAPALVDPHKEKTAEERARGAKADAAKKRHLGIKTEGPKIVGAGFQPVDKPSKISRAKIEKHPVQNNSQIAQMWRASQELGE